MGNARNRTKLFEKYQNKWVALTANDKVISSGTSVREVIQAALKKGFENPIISKMPDLRFDYLL